MAIMAIIQRDIRYYVPDSSLETVTVPKGVKVEILSSPDIEREAAACCARMLRLQAKTGQRPVVFSFDGAQRCAMIPDDLKPIQVGGVVPRAK